VVADKYLEIALDEMFPNEGGYVNDPDDPGGETKFGISKRSYPNEDIAGLTVDRAAEIYERDYWRPFLGVVNPRIKIELFDTAVNAGVGSAVRIAQRACNVLRNGSRSVGLAVDGNLGPNTLAEINRWGSVDDGHGPGSGLYRTMTLFQGTHYLNLAENRGMAKFFRGWTKRLQDWAMKGVNDGV